MAGITGTVSDGAADCETRLRRAEAQLRERDAEIARLRAQLDVYRSRSAMIRGMLDEGDLIVVEHESPQPRLAVIDGRR